MKIALYTGTFVKDKDGVARTLYEFIKSIRGTGHEVTIWSPDIQEKVKKPAINVEKVVSVPILLYPDYKLGFFGPKTKKQLDEMAPDIIHVSTPDLVGREFLQYGKRNNIPVVSAYHTDFPSYLGYYQLGMLNPPLWSYLRWFYNNSRLTLVPTKVIKERLQKRGIKNVVIWSRGISLDRFNPNFRSEELREAWNAHGKKVILYSGRLVWYKDLDIMVSVYEKLIQKREDILFVVLGSGPAENDLKKKMPEAIFPGYLTGKDLSRAYASSDILFFPSTTETFGNVIQEGLASGLPAVVSDLGGCMEIVKKSKGGLISKAKDPLSFEENVIKLIDDKLLYNILRNNGLNYSKKRSWNNINNKLLKKYEKLIDLP